MFRTFSMSVPKNLLERTSFNNSSTKRMDISIKLHASYPANSNPQFHWRKIMDDAPLGSRRAHHSRSGAQSITTTNGTPSMSDTRKLSNSRKSSRRVRMPDWEKMDDFMGFLEDKYYWTMEDLIHAYASTTLHNKTSFICLITSSICTHIYSLLLVIKSTFLYFNHNNYIAK